MEKVREKFWQRIYGDPGKATRSTLQLPENDFSSFIELLAHRAEPFASIAQPEEDGYYYPAKIGDTYALQIDYSGKRNDPDWENPNLADRVQSLKQTVLTKTHNLPPSLGQSWLISAQLTDPQQDEIATAKECYKLWSDRANWEQDCEGKGRCRGATFFELNYQDTIADRRTQNQQILICLFPATYDKNEMNRVIAQLYRDFIRLFLYRNKVLWVYEQSRQIKAALKRMNRVLQQMDSNLSQQISHVSVNLHQLQKILVDALSIFNQYQSLLSTLQGQITTIEINTHNYRSRVESLKQRDSQADLAFLERFNTYATEVCSAQIKTDSLIFHAEQKSLETFIKTVQGITDIEKAKNDRLFSRTVASATVGVSTASLATATLNKQSNTDIRALFPASLNGWWNVALPFFLSVMVGLIGASLTWILTWILTRKGEQRR